LAGTWATFHDKLADAAQRNGGNAATYRRTSKQYFIAGWGLIALGILVGAVGSWNWGTIPCCLALFLWLQGSSDRAVATRLKQMESTASQS
jgi:hypothetical protein